MLLLATTGKQKNAEMKLNLNLGQEQGSVWYDPSIQKQAACTIYKITSIEREGDVARASHANNDKAKTHIFDGTRSTTEIAIKSR
jgi:hypothetical protein